jgi:hypothetical protein
MVLLVLGGILVSVFHVHMFAHAHVLARTFAHMYTHSHTHMHGMHAHTYTHARTHTCANTHTRARTHTCANTQGSRDATMLYIGVEITGISGGVYERERARARANV